MTNPCPHTQFRAILGCRGMNQRVPLIKICVRGPETAAIPAQLTRVCRRRVQIQESNVKVTHTHGFGVWPQYDQRGGSQLWQGGKHGPSVPLEMVLLCAPMGQGRIVQCESPQDFSEGDNFEIMSVCLEP